MDFDKNEHLWAQKYRPQRVEDCILPEYLKKQFQQFVDQGEIPHLLLSSATPGTGKTTIAKAMCNEMGLDVLFINASEETGVDTIRQKVSSFASTVSLTDSMKVIICDEADHLSPNAQAALRGVLEQFSSNCSFIFTCNYKNKMMEAIRSRCLAIDFVINKDDLKKVCVGMLNRTLDILRNEGMFAEGEEVPASVKKSVAGVIQKYAPDNRTILNELQGYFNATGTIDEGILGRLKAVNIDSVMQLMKGKKYGQLRQWLEENQSLITEDFYTRFYKSIDGYIKPQAAPGVILSLADYQKYHSTVANPLLNVLACLTEIMMEAEWQ